MKRLVYLFAALLLFVTWELSAAPRAQPAICEVHKVPMFKRAVPYAHGMIPMSRVEAGRGEWKRRMDHYPHPGDCEPATDIVMPGEKSKTVVDVCPRCEAAMKEMQGRKP